MLYDFRKLAEAETDIINLYATLAEMVYIVAAAQDRINQTNNQAQSTRNQ